MTNWPLIAGGRCSGQPWRVGLAGFCVDTRQSFLLCDEAWAELQREMPLQPLMAYGAGNGLSFERLTEAACAVDGLLLIAHVPAGQAVFELPSQAQRYLLLSTFVQHEALGDASAFAKLFTPAQAPHFDPRAVALYPPLLADPASPDALEWPAVKAPEERDYARLYHLSADYWIWQVSSAIAADAAAVRQVQPLMSVVIPTYNYARYLGECVQSVLDQGVDDIEILVLDNASTDDTPQVMAAFADHPAVRYIRNRYNYGPGFNWRNGLGVAKGRYFTFLSADDFFNPGHLERLLPTLERHPHVAVGYTGIRWVNGAGQPLNQRRHPGYRNADYVGGRNEVADLLIYDSYMTPSAVIYRREVFLRVWRPTNSYGAGDWEMVVQMAEAYPDFAYIDAPGVSYRWHGAQESTQFYTSTDPLKGHLAIVEGVFERNAQHNLQGREREVAAHLKHRLGLYPREQDAELGARTRQLCHRLEGQAQRPQGPLFSIILTVLDGQTLGGMLDNLARQPIQALEVLLINASGDPLEPLLAGFAFPITYIRQGPGRTLVAARNAALNLARGDYVVYLDDADLHLPAHFQALVEALAAHPDSVVYKDAAFIPAAHGKAHLTGSGERLSRERLLVSRYLPSDTFACHRALALTLGGFDESLAG